MLMISPTSSRGQGFKNIISLVEEKRKSVDIEKENMRNKIMEESRKNARIKAKLADSGINLSARFKNATLDNYETPTESHKKAVGACKRFLSKIDTGDGLVLIGEPGGGKTHLLVAMIREAIEKYDKTGRIITTEDFFVGLRSCIQTNTSEAQYIENLSRFDVLAIDDIYSISSGKDGNEESYQYRMLWYLLDRRYRNMLPTLASTNVTLEKFKGMIDERTRRRFEANVAFVPKR